MDVDPTTVVHAYGVVAGGTALPLPDVGIAGSGVALLDAGPVAAVFSLLPESAYGAAAWREHAEDPHWLAQVAQEHHKVLTGLIENTDVLPMRLPAMYLDETHLHEVLAAEATFFRAALDAVHDYVEWGVQLFLSRRAEIAVETPASGRDYLRRRSDAARQRDQDRARRQDLVQAAYAGLANVARQSTANPPQDPTLSGRGEPMLLNSAHLVSRHHEEPFFAAVQDVAARLSPEGITVEVSGPWPPYNFVELGDSQIEARL